MAKQIIFISSVQSEFANERQALYDYIISDSLLGRFFDPFIFENLPASDQRVDTVYLQQVEQSHIYLALIGKKYGSTDSEGISPTEKEFNHATKHFKTRLAYITTHKPEERDKKENLFIDKIQSVLIRKSFSSIDELKSSLYASLVNYLIEKEIIRTGPFDTTLHSLATISDIDNDKVIDFVRIARYKRGFPLNETTPIKDILTHLNLINNNRLTNAAILLFGKEPQRFFINSEIRCVHFYGNIVEKPIPSYKVFKGDVFELVDQAVDFVLSKLDYSIGTRSKDISIPGKYEIPKEVISEVIVNAVAHRDYTSNGSVQVMLFQDRLEVENPGYLPLGWTIEKLKTTHYSIPANPLLSEPMYLKGYIERLGTGIMDVLRISKENNLREPEFIQNDSFKAVLFRPSAIEVPSKYRRTTIEVPKNLSRTSVEVINLLNIIEGEMSRKEMQDKLKLKNEGNFRKIYLEPALLEGYIEMKYPKFNHPNQKYLLTEKGKKILLDE